MLHVRPPGSAVGGLPGGGDLLVPPTKWMVVMLRPPCAAPEGKCPDGEDFIKKMGFCGM